MTSAVRDIVLALPTYLVTAVICVLVAMAGLVPHRDWFTTIHLLIGDLVHTLEAFRSQ